MVQVVVQGRQAVVNQRYASTLIVVRRMLSITLALRTNNIPANVLQLNMFMQTTISLQQPCAVPVAVASPLAQHASTPTLEQQIFTKMVATCTLMNSQCVMGPMMMLISQLLRCAVAVAVAMITRQPCVLPSLLRIHVPRAIVNGQEVFA